MDNELKELQCYVDKLRTTASTKTKEAILKEYNTNSAVKNMVWWVLNPYKTFGITSKQVRKASYKVAPSDNPVEITETLLHMLAERTWTGHKAVAEILGFIEANKEHEFLIYQIIDKDIETRANATLVNKVWGKGFVPKFDVALAKSYDDVAVDYYKDTWYASRKLDGLRCICAVNPEGNARFYSRKGIEFTTLGVLKDAVKKSGLKDVVLDGEICIMNGELEDFTQISKEYNKKNHTIENPKFFIFDNLTPTEFANGYSDYPLSSRLGAIVIAELPEHFTLLDQRRVSSDEEVVLALISANDAGQEGLILRKDTDYKGKRSSDILKVKSFHDAEFEVKAIEFGDMRFFEDGEDVERQTMTKAIISYKGNDVGVGSGWSKEERADFYDHPNKIVGTTITVKYKKESKDSEGNVSLQFPTLKTIHYGGRKA